MCNTQHHLPQNIAVSGGFLSRPWKKPTFQELCLPMWMISRAASTHSWRLAVISSSAISVSGYVLEGNLHRGTQQRVKLPRGRRHNVVGAQLLETRATPSAATQSERKQCGETHVPQPPRTPSF